MKYLHEIALQWIDAFNKKNIQQLLNLYHEEAKHYSPRLKKLHPETNGIIVGKDKMHDWWLSAFDRMPDLQYIVHHIVAENDIIYIEYIRKTNQEEDTIVNERLIVKNKLIIDSKVFIS